MIPQLPLIGRRALIAGAVCAPFAARAAAPGPRTRLILLGTGGGPTPKPNRSASATAIVIDGRIHIVDCGDGVARQLVLAGLKSDALAHIYLTHHHSDHNADYGNLLLLAWANNLAHPVDTWGPPPLERMTRQFLALNKRDIKTRIADEGRPPLAPLIRAHELNKGGTVFEDGQVRVTAALVNHPPIVPSFCLPL